MATAKSAAKAAKKAAYDINNIKDGTVAGVEELALEFIKSTLDNAHAADGFRGVIQFCLALVQEADKINVECHEQGMNDRAAQAATALYIGNQWCDKMSEGFIAIVELGGSAKFEDASPEEIEAAVLAHKAAKAAAKPAEATA